jgi:hypothetical protein
VSEKLFTVILSDQVEDHRRELVGKRLIACDLIEAHGQPFIRWTFEGGSFQEFYAPNVTHLTKS